jgi:hypothetical protein
LKAAGVSYSARRKTFRASSSRRRQTKVSHYTGDITKLGVDVGYTNAGVLVWAVIAPSADMQPDALEGKYAGATAGVTAVVGGNLNVMVGGLDKSFTLQPLSVEGNTGISLTAAVGAMELNYEKP